MGLLENIFGKKKEVSKEAPKGVPKEVPKETPKETPEEIKRRGEIYDKLVNMGKELFKEILELSEEVTDKEIMKKLSPLKRAALDDSNFSFRFNVLLSIAEVEKKKEINSEDPEYQQKIDLIGKRAERIEKILKRVDEWPEIGLNEE